MEAGVILGILPLLVVALEHYEDVLRPFERYRKFSSKLATLQRELKIQKAIFHNQSYLLASRLTDKVTADRFFAKRWSLQDNPHIDLDCAAQLSRSAEPCKELIRAMESHLHDLEEETKQFETIITDAGTEDASQNASKQWFRQVRKKIKFSFSAPRFEKAITGLRLLNQDFIHLSSQIMQMGPSRRTVSWLQSTTVRSAEWNIEEYRLARKASRHLYEALGKACTVHHEHSVNLCLDTIPVCCDEADSIHVEFSIAFTHMRPTGGMPTVKPTWLVIESVISEAAVGGSPKAASVPEGSIEEVFSDLTDTLTRQALSSPSNTGPQISSGGKHVRLAAVISKAQTEDRQHCLSLSRTREPSLKLELLPNFGEKRDFCIRLQHCHHQSGHTKECLGFLDRTNVYQHLVYRSPNKLSNPNKRLISLAQLVSWISERKATRGLPQIERLRLARQLASAVLKLHATPWLARTWRSEDVFFIDQEPEATNQLTAILTAPHLSVPVVSDQVATSISADTFNRQSLVRNPVLFSLGVILLELGYEAPMQSLQQPEDLPDGLDSRYIDFFAATRLSMTLGSTLGPTYAAIVQKLLACDFGHGNDLDDPELQAAFYSDVVCRLEKLEEGLRKLVE